MKFLLFFLSLTFFSYSASLLELASKFMQQGQYDKAEILLHKAKDNGESETIVEYNLAYVYFKKGKASQAIASYNHVIALSPRFINAYHNLARIYYQIESYDKAVDEVKLSIEKDPLNSASYMLLGDLYYQIEAYDLALNSYEKASEISPSDNEPYFAMVDLYDNFGDYDKALNILDLAEQKLGELSVGMTRQRATLLMKDKQYLKAAAVYERMIEVTDSKDDRYELYSSLVDTYTSANMNLMAIEVLHDMIKQYPEKDEVLEVLNNIYEKEGRLSDAVDFYGQLYDTNKMLGYKAIRALFYGAYTSDDVILLKKIMTLYENKKLNDSLYKTVKDKIGV